MRFSPPTIRPWNTTNSQEFFPFAGRYYMHETANSNENYKWHVQHSTCKLNAFIKCDCIEYGHKCFIFNIIYVYQFFIYLQSCLCSELLYLQTYLSIRDFYAIFIVHVYWKLHQNKIIRISIDCVLTANSVHIFEFQFYHRSKQLYLLLA